MYKFFIDSKGWKNNQIAIDTPCGDLIFIAGPKNKTKDIESGEIFIDKTTDISKLIEKIAFVMGVRPDELETLKGVLNIFKYGLCNGYSDGYSQAREDTFQQIDIHGL